jgi:multicomponent Na+:H+ antiporter subunit F
MKTETAYTILYVAAITWMTLLMGVMLVRSVKGPGVTNRLIDVNMSGTLVNGVILVLSGLLDESWLVDVALIYTMISFATVLILTRVTLQASAAKAQLSGNGTEGNSHE